MCHSSLDCGAHATPQAAGLAAMTDASGAKERPRSARQAALAAQAQRARASVSNGDSKARHDWLSQARSLATKAKQAEQEAGLERLCRNPLFRDCERDLLALAETHLAASEEREGEAARLSARLRKINGPVARLRSLLQRHADSEAACSVAELQQCMDAAAGAILSLKSAEAELYDSMASEADALGRELAVFDTHFSAWEAADERPPPQAAAGATGSRSVVLAPARSVPPAVAECDRFEAAYGGPTGGWDAADHAIFTRIRAAYESTNAHTAEADAAASTELSPALRTLFLGRAVAELPTRSAAEIETHEVWYAQHARLAAAKRQAIREWRERRAAEAAAPPRVLVEPANAPAGPPAAGAPLSPGAQAAAARREREALEKAHAIQAFRARKQNARVLAELLARHEARAAQAQARARALEQEAKRETVAHYRALREAEARWREEEERRRVESARVPPSAAELARCQARDLERAAQRREAARAKRRDEREKHERLAAAASSLAPRVARDVTRLQAPTAAHVARVSSQAEEQTLFDRAPVAAARRAVPTWRKAS